MRKQCRECYASGESSGMRRVGNTRGRLLEGEEHEASKCRASPNSSCMAPASRLAWPRASRLQVRVANRPLSERAASVGVWQGALLPVPWRQTLEATDSTAASGQYFV